MSKVPFNEVCRTCMELPVIFHTDEDNAYFIRIMCNSCEKFGICNRCCRKCPENTRNHNIQFSVGVYEPQPNDNNISYTINYSSNTDFH